MSEVLVKKKTRDSNIELLRIIMMIIIVGHHYIVNSGIIDVINSNIVQSVCGIKDYFALVFGWGGKTAINVFLLITGYFSCKQNFNLKKIIFFCLEIMFYKIVIFCIFLFSGYEKFNLLDFGKMILTIPYGFGKGFTSSYIALYFCIPFVNKLIMSIEKKEFEKLLIVLLVIFTVISTFFLNTTFEYLGWYVTVYLIGAYIRMYPISWFDNEKITGGGMLICLLLSWLSVLVISFVSNKLGRVLPYFYFVADSNKILAIFTAIFMFLFAKSINIGSNKFINLLSASTFGVLMIHANSNTMRKWLWQDVCKNVEIFTSSTFLQFIFHAVVCTLVVYIVCVFIDIIRKNILNILSKKGI